MKTYPIYCGGEFITTDTKLPVTCSFDDKVFAETYMAGLKELEIAIEKGLTVKKQMAEMPSYKKYEALLQISNELLRRKNEIAEVLSLEACKPIKLAIGEVDRAAQTFIAAAEESKRIPGHTMSIDWAPHGEGKEGIVKYFPVGLVAGIAPFNFPLNLPAHKVAPALASGNPIIIKPARKTPLSLLLLAEIIDKTSFPKGCLSVLPMDRVSGNMLVTDPRFAKLTFTGSAEVGWAMKAMCGKKRITLELGGNAGVIVTPSSDLKNAVQKCVGGAYAYAGQVCIHAQRLYVHESVYDAFLAEFKEQASRLKTGHPMEESTQVSAMIDKENAERVEQWVNEAVAQGAKLEMGGTREGNLYYPTLLSNVKNTMKVSCQEVFGPVTSIEKYNDFEDAVQRLNNSDFGLQAGVFTNLLSEMNYAFSHIEAGGVMINEVPTFRVDHMPYGGVKDSGFGREGVRYAMMEMLEPKLLVKNV
ncbi:MAG: aldehyde dehydrogenase [Bacteroidetes bacterium HGW-Bacteroidetes-21]|nr:MAG: aldehyde dehydrogenase [Bacteroidetes bacterium HGW-Bacteroidetes-21]